MNLPKLPRGVGTLPLVFILFFCTSGGPYSTETLIHSVGPGLGLVLLLLVPIVWSIPEVLIVGELASMLPEEQLGAGWQHGSHLVEWSARWPFSMRFS